MPAQRASTAPAPKKAKKEDPMEDEELNTKVTAELSAHFIGTMKVRWVSMTPVWDDFMVN